MNAKLLVKLGGTLLDEPGARARLCAEIAGVFRRSPQMAIVHGGGKQMTRYLTERGVESRFVGGLRVSSPDVIDAVLKVFAGTVNHQLVASLVAAGTMPVGLTGIDACLTEAERWSEELGQVGRPVRSNTALLDVLNANGYLPVVACVAGDRNGVIYNVNADQMAAACAAGFSASRLLFLTDVAGVMDASKQVLPTLTRAESQNLIDTGVATGGMQAKLEAAHRALDGGVAEVIVAPGAEPGVIGRILDGVQEGTRIVP
ncbi:MAG: acetylglutamate kinase [Bryobacteraceae bacterium]